MTKVFQGPDGLEAVLTKRWGRLDLTLGHRRRITYFQCLDRTVASTPWNRNHLERLAMDWAAHGVGWCESKTGTGLPRRGVMSLQKCWDLFCGGEFEEGSSIAKMCLREADVSVKEF